MACSSRPDAVQFLAWQTTGFHPPLGNICLLGILKFILEFTFCSQWLYAPSGTSFPPILGNMKLRAPGQGEAGSAGVGRVRAARCSQGTPQDIGARRAPRARSRTGAFAECYCHLVLPSFPCAELLRIGVRAQPQGKAPQLTPSLVILEMSVELHRFSMTVGERIRRILSPYKGGAGEDCWVGKSLKHSSRQLGGVKLVWVYPSWAEVKHSYHPEFQPHCQGWASLSLAQNYFSASSWKWMVAGEETVSSSTESPSWQQTGLMFRDAKHLPLPLCQARSTGVWQLGVLLSHRVSIAASCITQPHSEKVLDSRLTQWPPGSRKPTTCK